MSLISEIAPELRARVDSIAARSGLSPAEVIADALENGHSLAWQERFLDKIDAATAAADRGDFASAAEMERVRNKYRQS